jgi:Na+-translocating ferredoxin:NAD+ oxidoreductase RnfD subunit
MNPGAITALPIASPHAHGGNSVSRTMFRVQMALVPATFYGFWLFGWPAFFLWLLTILSCLFFEALSLKMMGVVRIKATLFDGSALLTGWLLAMTLPPWAPWWVAVLGGFIAIVIGKQVFGGVGQNVFNPAMVARVALLVSFPVPLTQWVSPLPLSSLAAPDFIDGLRIFLTSLPQPDAMASASLLGFSKTEMSRGIDLFHSLTGNHAPALSWIGTRSGSLGESASLLILGGGFICWQPASSPGKHHLPFWPGWLFPLQLVMPLIPRIT